MKVETPSRYVGALVTGLVRSGGIERLHAAVVIKASYELVETGVNTYRAAPLPDSDPIMFADEGTTYPKTIDGQTYTLFDTRYEADIAVEKARADIIVEGWLNPARQGAVLVDGALWMTRNGAGTDPDTRRNLFGWQPKMQGGRKPTIPEDFVPTPGAQLPPGYTPSFNNAHRRGAPFSVTGAIRAEIARDAHIEIHRTANHSDDNPLSISLNMAPMKARYRTYCGHGPDKPHIWAITALPRPRLDTVILAPDSDGLTAIWRTGFDPAANDASAYRAIQIFEEVA